MKKQNEESGQALIELIIFLPLIISLYAVIAGFASSINGSINQQKVSRAYFYYRIQNNSTIPGPRSGNFDTWKQFGMFYIGWKERFAGDGSVRIPIMPCYKVDIPFQTTPTDNCEDAYTVENTIWVRVGTVYGMCGGTYFNNNGKINAVPDGGESDFSSLSDRSGCIITQ